MSCRAVLPSSLTVYNRDSHYITGDQLPFDVGDVLLVAWAYLFYGGRLCYVALRQSNSLRRDFVMWDRRHLWLKGRCFNAWVEFFAFTCIDPPRPTVRDFTGKVSAGKPVRGVPTTSLKPVHWPSDTRIAFLQMHLCNNNNNVRLLDSRHNAQSTSATQGSTNALTIYCALCVWQQFSRA